MSEKPEITVVVPYFNPSPIYIRQTVDSLITQSAPLSSFRVIFVDDGSTNSVVSELSPVIESSGLDAQFVCHETNQGLNEARRTGVKFTTTEWLLFLDSDDLLTSDAIELLQLEISKKNADAVFGPIFRLEEGKGNFLLYPLSEKAIPDGEKRLEMAFRGEFSFTMCGRLFRKNDLTDEVFELERRIYHEDCVILPRILARVRRINVLNQPIYVYRQNQKSITTTTSVEHLESLDEIVRNWVQLVSELKLNRKRLEPCLLEGIHKMYTTINSRISLDKVDRKSLGKANSNLNDTLHKSLKVGASYKIEETCVSGDQNQANLLGKTVRYRTSYELKDKVVLIALADYQMVAALHLARGLRDSGIPVTVIDFSQSVASGKRKFKHSDNSRQLAHRVEVLQRDSGFQASDLLMCRLVIAFNDFNPLLRDALEGRRAFGLPSVAFIEGINDFDRVDSGQRSLRPYRRSTHRALAGGCDLPYFQNFQNTVIGLPLIAELADRSVKSDLMLTGKRAVLNVNFTYGVLEEHRDLFTTLAIKACERVGIELQITRHPMDEGVVGRGLDSDKRQSELLQEDVIFISRFGTGIIEALANGVPVIYFNPHQERVEKFKDPMSAYLIASTAEELERAIREIQEKIKAGHDFKKSARSFLQAHANIDNERDDNLQQVRQRTVKLVQDLTDASKARARDLNAMWLLEEIS